MEILRYIRRFLYLVILILSYQGLAQIRSANDAYEQLDLFNETPTQEHILVFQKDLRGWNPNSKEELLAKVISLCNLGYQQERKGLFQDAIKNYESAKKLFLENSLSNFNMFSSCYQPLGTLYTKLNALSEAENTIKEYILLAQQQGNTTAQVAGFTNLSVVFQNKGSFSHAISVLEQGLLLEPKNQKLQLNLAVNYLSLGNVKVSEELAKSILKKSPNNAKVLQLWAQIQISKGSAEAAIESLDKAYFLLAEQKEVGPREKTKLLLSITSLNLEFGKLEEAKNGLQEIYKLLLIGYSEDQVLPNANQLFAENSLMDALDIHAQLLQKESNYTMAFDSYELAQKVSNLLNSPLLLQDSKLILQNNMKDRVEETLGVLFKLHKKTKDSIWLSKALQVEQRSKSPVLREAMEWQRSLVENFKSEWVMELQNISREMAIIQNTMERQKKTVGPGLSELKDLQTSYNSKAIAKRTILARMDSLLPSKTRNNDISLGDLQKILRAKNEVMVSYFIGRNSVYQFVVNEASIEFNRLYTTPKERNNFVRNCIQFVGYFETSSAINNNPKEFSKIALQLHERLNLPSVKNLVINPDGMLSFVPFNSLVTGASESISFLKMPFLIKRSSISYVLSIDNYLKESASDNEEMNVLGVFPVFEGTNKNLQYSLDEASGISGSVNTTLLLNGEATAEGFLTQEKEYPIAHISTHARGGTFTSPAAIEFIDRELTITELYGYQFKKQLVVLSACETGVGRINKGEGAQSIARAFQYAGAENILYTLWKVNDYTTAQIMILFYNELSNGESYSKAIHNAQLSYLENADIDNAKKSPYYWSGFVYYGETASENKGNHLLFWFLLIGGLLSLFLLKKLRKS